MTASSFANLPFAHPSRTRSAFKPVKALGHFRKLIADKEDTEQVFHIINALRGSRFFDDAKAFWDSPTGRQVMADDEYLPDILDDHDALRALPAGTVGRAYLQFMEREGLSAAGLVAEYDKFRDRTEHHDDLVEKYGNRLRDTHDLFHVLTGYGRDALGEQCVLAFSYSQNPNLGILFIAYAGGREIKKRLPAEAPLYAAIREGQRTGKQAGHIAHQNIRALLAEPLEAARKRLNIGEPVLYRQCHEAMQSAGVDPFNLLAAA